MHQNQLLDRIYSLRVKVLFERWKGLHSANCSSVVKCSLMVRKIPGLKSAQGQKISCYACWALEQDTLLSFTPLHPGELNGYRSMLGKQQVSCAEKCNFEKIDILYHDYLTSFQFVFILCDESRHLLEINNMFFWNQWVIFFLINFLLQKCNWT